ncbi:MAG: hypothetical protein DDT30_01666 [Dehalococcoidia bacterium]|nr:hypothetical protein [Bacillota bacterium]
MILVRVSAYTGVRARVGGMVNRGDLIGVDPNTRDAVPSPASGVVKEVNFDPASHTLTVGIESKERAAIRGRRRSSNVVGGVPDPEDGDRASKLRAG